jgi:CRISPR/Cas system-associated endonuclease Cas3-HD
MKEILSFYEKKDEKEIKEILIGDPKGHVEQMLELIKDINYSKYAHYAKSIDPNYEPHLVLALAIVFHDAGKVFYQGDITAHESLSFKGHEFFSVYLFNELKKNVLKNDPNNSLFKNFSYIIEFAIFYHHHAMNIPQRKEIFREIKEEKLRKNLELLRYFLDQASNFSEIRENISSETIKSMVNTIQKSIYNYDFIKFFRHEVEEEIERPVWKELQGCASKLKLSFLTLSALITVDNIAASRRSEKDTTEKIDAFSNAIHDFYDFYLSYRSI